jgi:lysophospholipase L1-like esterase
MKFKILAALAALSMIPTFCHAQSVTTVSMADSGVRIMGRAAITSGSATFGFPGQEIELRFSGSSSVTMTGEVLSNQGWFNVYLDGALLPRLEIPTGAYSIKLAESLDKNKTHLLRIVRRNEAWQGVVKVKGFELDGGAKILPPAPLPERRILAIGDSITCGQYTELMPPVKPGNHAVNAELAYGWLLAKDFNAQIHLVSYGGKGLLRDWRGLHTGLSKAVFEDAGKSGKAPEIISAPDFFERALPDDPSILWDHSQYQPDLILICLGQNDFSQIELPPSEYADAYIKFLDRIHEVYPKAHVLILSSPMAEMTRTDGWIPRGAAIQLALTLVNQHYIHKGELWVMPVFLAHQPGTELDAHPTAPQHRAMADELKPVIKSVMGW